MAHVTVRQHAVPDETSGRRAPNERGGGNTGAPEHNDAERFRAVAEACKAMGMHVGTLRVGDVEVRLAEPWGPPVPKAERRPRAEDDPTVSDEMRELRRRSRKQFGRVLPDQKLQAMKHVLLGQA